ncbi:uncharacterized protein LOC136715818 [Amia ocellicauda]|uniref:uncharacterized protein LOC136715818 n=1 Tax=Amia ocellicauda TaxID=2972642 RepID=UPI003464B628
MSERYRVIQQAARISGAKSEEYADFLLEHERKCGPDGFLDSKKYRHPYLVKGGLGLNLPSKKGSSLSGQQQKAVADRSFTREWNPKEHKHGIEFIEKCVSRAEEAEFKLSSKMHSAEYKSKKMKTRTNDLLAQLDRLRKQNSDQLLRNWVAAKKSEEVLTLQLRKEISELQKYEREKESCYQSLIKHRALQKEDQHILENMQTEHRRMLNIRKI